MKKKLIAVLLVIVFASLVGFASKQDTAKMPNSPQITNTQGKPNIDSLIQWIKHQALKGGNPTAQLTPPSAANQPIQVTTKLNQSPDGIFVSMILVPGTQQVAMNGSYTSTLSGPVSDTSISIFNAPSNGNIETILPGGSIVYTGVTNIPNPSINSLQSIYYDSFGDSAKIAIFDMFQH